MPGVPAVAGCLTLLSPEECRGPDQGALTDQVLGVTRFSPKRSWKAIFGWDKEVPREVLFRQLDICLEKRLHEKVAQVLHHLKPEE